MYFIELCTIDCSTRKIFVDSAENASWLDQFSIGSVSFSLFSVSFGVVRAEKVALLSPAPNLYHFLAGETSAFSR